MAWAWVRGVKLKRHIKRALIAAIVVCFLITSYLGIVGLPNPKQQRSEGGSAKLDTRNFKRDVTLDSVHGESGSLQHRLAVIVPFRDRFEELITFAPFIHRYLNHKGIQHDIFIVNQFDNLRFNRASLINAGYLFATKKQVPPCDYIVMHDVDLLPLNNDLPYDYPENNTVTHVAAPGLHPKYNYANFIGGILVVSSKVFQQVNGMSNIYWGWGLEDDEFYVRLKQNKIQVKRPEGVKTGKSNTFRHSHNAKVRTRDMDKCFDQWNKTRRRDHLTGVNSLNYTLVSVSEMTIEQAPLTLLNIKLDCDVNISPWCECNRKPIGGNTKNSVKSIKSSQKVKRRKI